MTERSGISRAVLITGCSSGIGHATALRLNASGWPVYATARRVEAIADLATAGCRVLPLDVTDEASMEAAVRTIEEREGAVGVLINNAGYSQSGAFESVPIDRVRSQFETNLFGPVHLTQLVLPGMRRQRWGKIVNLSSMGGRLTFPGGGFYHGTKYAIEAISDALRFEVAGFGIDVIVIEPGITRSGFGEAAAATVDAPRDDPYAAFNVAVTKVTKEVYERGLLAHLGGEPDDTARAIERALTAEHPKARYPVTPSARLMMGLRRWLPDRVWDAIMRQQFPQPK